MHVRNVVLAGAALVAALAPDLAEAQRRPARRTQTIEIRGQVPTPQVVTVRPREVPTYARRVLSPNYYDRTFWPNITPAYQLVPQRALTGAGPLDSTIVLRGGGAATPTLGAGAAPAAVAPTLGPAGTASPAFNRPLTPREQELLAIQRELEQRRRRLDSLQTRADSLYRPRSSNVLNDTLPALPDSLRVPPPSRTATPSSRPPVASRRTALPIASLPRTTMGAPRRLSRTVPGTAPAKSAR